MLSFMQFLCHFEQTLTSAHVSKVQSANQEGTPFFNGGVTANNPSPERDVNLLRKKALTLERKGSPEECVRANTIADPTSEC